MSAPLQSQRLALYSLPSAGYVGALGHSLVLKYCFRWSAYCGRSYKPGVFPLYPFLIRAGNYFLFDFRGHRITFIWLGILSAIWLFLARCSSCARSLLRVGFSENFARGTLWLLLITHLAFFFTIYTESIFIFLVLATDWFLPGKTLAAGSVTAALLMIARPLAQLVVIPIAISTLCKQRSHSLERCSQLCPRPTGGIWLYLDALLISGDWLMFIRHSTTPGARILKPIDCVTYLDPNHVLIGYII